MTLFPLILNDRDWQRLDLLIQEAVQYFDDETLDDSELRETAEGIDEETFEDPGKLLAWMKTLDGRRLAKFLRALSGAIRSQFADEPEYVRKSGYDTGFCVNVSQLAQDEIRHLQATRALPEDWTRLRDLTQGFVHMGPQFKTGPIFLEDPRLIQLLGPQITEVFSGWEPLLAWMKTRYWEQLVEFLEIVQTHCLSILADREEVRKAITPSLEARETGRLAANLNSIASRVRTRRPQ